MKKCKDCGRSFRDRDHLNRHVQGHHTDAPKYLCPVCGRNCRYEFGLRHHMHTHVRKSLKCSSCRAIFSTADEANSHKQSCPKRLQCFYCGSYLASKNSFREHIKRVHPTWEISSKHQTPQKPPRTKEDDKKCPLCNEVFRCYADIEDHFTNGHEITLERLSMTFDNKQKFYDWKEQLETSTTSYFFQYRAQPKTIAGARRMTFQCHRVGKPQLMSAERRKRCIKVIGSNKINAYCPARLCVNFMPNGSVVMNCILTHIGHDFTFHRVPMPRQLRQEIAHKIAMNVSFDDILNAYRKDMEDGNMRREHLLTRKDLNNIKRNLKSDFSSRLDRTSESITQESELEPAREANDEPERNERENEKEDDREETYDAEMIDESGVLMSDGTNCVYECYVIAETEDTKFNEFSSVRPSPVSRLRDEIRATIDQVLDTAEDEETLLRVRKAVREIQVTMLR